MESTLRLRIAADACMEQLHDRNIDRVKVYRESKWNFLNVHGPSCVVIRNVCVFSDLCGVNTATFKTICIVAYTCENYCDYRTVKYQVRLKAEMLCLWEHSGLFREILKYSDVVSVSQVITMVFEADVTFCLFNLSLNTVMCAQ